MMNNKWLNFKFLSGAALLTLTTILSFCIDGGLDNDIWLIVWMLCMVRLVDALDDIDKA